MAWSSFRTQETITETNFKNMREGGFTISLSLISDMALIMKTLQVAEKTGMKVMINCPRMRNLSTIPSAIPKVRNNNAVMGYYLADEPTASYFPKLRILRDTIYKYDSKHIPFVNLFPAIEPSRLHADSYKNYLLEFVRQVDLPMFSYDNYPIIKKDGKVIVKDNFYENLEIASDVTRKTGKPFWAFCLSSSHFNYPTPTKADLTFEAFSALAYGAQGLSYYTYKLVTTQTIEYFDAPVSLEGKLTPVWYLCRDVNNQIQSLKKVFLGAKLQNAWHTGKSLPKGTKRLTKLPGPFTDLKTQDSGVLVSHLKNDNVNYLIIVSHDILNAQQIKLYWKGSGVTQISSDSQPDPNPGNLFILQPGGYIIFSWK